MTKYLLFLISILILTIASVNMSISRAVYSKVTSASQRHSQTPLFQNQQKLYSKYVENGQMKMRVAALLVLGCFIVLFIGKPVKLAEIKWQLPFLVFFISWVFIILGYVEIAGWSEKMFYTGDRHSASPGGYLYGYVFSCYAICNPGSFFKTLWVIKICLLVISIALQVFLFKKEAAKHNRLFVTIVVLDMLLGSLTLAILHDNIDITHRIIDLDFAPKF